jgi:ParB-like chromosome segregation protein Spo0J
MSGHLKLSKVFYIDPKTLPIPKPVSPRNFPIFNYLKNSILTKGFDPSYPIIVRMNEKEYKEEKWKIDDRPSYITDGNHRLVIALELKLEKIPVRFVLN